ncbi:MAG TPA: G1 family glutamic endopeptidase [Solirubrobacteraceae bacterium]
MLITPSTRRRRVIPLLAVSATVAVVGAFAIDAVTASAQTVTATQQQSRNWAGYIVQSSTGKSFSSVSGSWKQPATSSSSPDQGYSAFWVGLGGASGQSQSLEQVGTSADWVNGQAQYYAWYELVPSAQVKLNIAISPGDQISGKVTVSGTTVTISLSDQTTGQSVTNSLQMSNPDTSSAEWIAEAPSAAVQPGVYQTLPLANFGTATFTGLSATADGHTGSISDPSWSVQQVQLSPTATAGDAGGGGSFTPAGLGGGSSSSSGASTSNISSDGSSFSVSYAPTPSSAQSSTAGSGSSGYDSWGGYGDQGYGYGYGYGYDGQSAYTY